MTDENISLPAPQDRAEPTPTVRELHLFDVYAALGVDWGNDIFAEIARLKAVAAPARAHQEEKEKETPVRDMGEATEDGDRICEWCNQQVPRRHRCVAGPNPCSVCGTYLWGDPRPCWNCARQNDGDLARSATPEIGDPQPAAVSDAGSQNDCAETHSFTPDPTGTACGVCGGWPDDPEHTR